MEKHNVRLSSVILVLHCYEYIMYKSQRITRKAVIFLFVYLFVYLVNMTWEVKQKRYRQKFYRIL